MKQTRQERLFSELTPFSLSQDGNKFGLLEITFQIIILQLLISRPRIQVDTEICWSTLWPPIDIIQYKQVVFHKPTHFIVSLNKLSAS